MINFIPFVPREISTVYFCGGVLALAGASSLVLPILVVLLMTYFSWYLFSVETKKLRSVRWIVLTINTCLFGAILAYPIVDVMHQSAKKVVNITPKEDALYSIDLFSYASGKDKHRKEFSEDALLITQSIDVSDSLPGWEGFSGWYRSYFWGFDKTQIPLNAQVWMPMGDGPFPLVLIAHGDHAMQDFSDTGYDYLGKSLAAQGYIVASLDNKFLNRSWSDLMLTYSLTGSGEIKTRALLMVEHLKLWANWNEDSQTLLYQKVDLSKVAVIGHSRGGEAVAHVPHLLTAQKREDIGVKTVIAIAPVDGYYWPNDRANVLQDTNYMVLHGSLDGEMFYAGSGQYSRTRIAGSQALTKAAIYIDGANHGQFNSTWGACDNEFFSPLCMRWNVKD